MIFHSPSWVPKLANPPSSVTIPEFIFDESTGRAPFAQSRDPFVCGITGKSFSVQEVKERVDLLARGLAPELNWSSNAGTEFEKVVAVFSLNSIDYGTVSWATHLLGGLVSPVSAAYTAKELEFQLRDSKAKCLFTCSPLLEIALIAAKAVGIPENRIYVLQVAGTGVQGTVNGLKTVDDLIRNGRRRPSLERLRLGNGDGARRAAFLCYSSGTSGFPKGVMISHRNVISNILQVDAYERLHRESAEVALGILPMSHIYGLIMLLHENVYRGDSSVVLPKFDFAQSLDAIQRFKITTLFLVPPIFVLLIKSKSVVEQHDLSSVIHAVTGAAPLGEETAAQLQQMFPRWLIRQGYGLTETSTVVSSTSGKDIWMGSCGSLIPGCEARLVTEEGKEVENCDQAGELLIRSPSVALGYFNNPKANNETFKNGWLCTGDKAMFRKAPSGNQHLFIIDRMKELVKVKGHQVAPAELETHLLTHPAVGDCAVIPVPDEYYGEVPKAFVTKSSSVCMAECDALVKQSILRHAKQGKANYKWLRGGVEFIDAIPKSPSGKILRRVLIDQERRKKRQIEARL
ncbi:phenylacetyl-CoA ligase [Patellaria atrata CBS 101060]|uniref:Phenylacetyl-CoA ligase n=1 Tax=Patellaria atrata CBS 101060 TaxID=1346257 RepID=A0A9P4SK25_9PEZI|nr:phenylacetyl-CoA ligase [Patellaria atrata CBS 101060]